MSKKVFFLEMCFFALLIFTGCGRDTISTPLPQNNHEITVESTPSTDVVLPESPIQQDNIPLTDDEIIECFTETISKLETSVVVNIRGHEWKYGAENDLKNIFYSVISEHPELKYAYDMNATVIGDTAECTFYYMPYKTGSYANGVPAGSHIINSLHDAEVMAQSMIDGTSSISIAITNETLEYEALQRAVAQAGYGWIAFSLNRDGTAIEATSPIGMTLSECADRINESFTLGSEIIKSNVTEGMTDYEKVEALYTYITSNTVYDQRYYTDKINMPYESTVALGSFRDHLAICGGYSHALETLLDMCGIENYTVSGTANGEYHVWNYIVLDGIGYYCDPTYDRGGMNNHFMLTFDELTNKGMYKWDAVFYSNLQSN